MMDAEFYTFGFVIGEYVTLDEAASKIEEVSIDELPLYDGDLLAQEELMEKIKDAIENPPAEGEQWQVGMSLFRDAIITFDGKRYKVLHNHVTQADWLPPALASLYLLLPDAGVIPDWEQPQSHNPYMKGDKVNYKGEVYESLIDNNVWSPEAYLAGWRKL